MNLDTKILLSLNLHVKICKFGIYSKPLTVRCLLVVIILAFLCFFQSTPRHTGAHYQFLFSYFQNLNFLFEALFSVFFDSNRYIKTIFQRRGMIYENIHVCNKAMYLCNQDHIRFLDHTLTEIFEKKDSTCVYCVCMTTKYSTYFHDFYFRQ